ncbi:hypothetical protein SAMN04487936_11520 [Halobacillus dabanensis]|uniref:Uncharacterized protein n=1 Tax=Halobacillus dabanensis TaxID=240302 RepID=A0A1I3ZXB9_HALDA|nr:hypothetical protein [Halobacillus dabanensis]SFK48331.1 hypothetical protein SAMN04487936_11520 [Halobacillus dabanensis]
MRKIFFILTIGFIISLLAACGDNESSQAGGETNNDSDKEPKELTVDSVIDAFQQANLEAENPTDMTKDDYGMAPMKADVAKRFLIPSLGQDAGGRIFSYENSDDLKEMKSYYDDLGKESAMFFSHTASRENILIQVNGELKDEQFEKYEEVLNTIGTGDIPKYQAEEKVTMNEAEAGESVEGEWGTYKILNTSTPEETSYTSEPIKFSVPKVLLATFIPNEESKDLFEQEEINLAIALINSENTSEDTVSFHPFSAKVTTDTKGQYGAQEMLNKGDSEHIGQVKQEFVIPYNLEDEDLSKIKELEFHFDGTAKDATTIGEDVVVPVSFE